MGARVKDFYGVMGVTGYDIIFIVEAPDDQEVAKSALMIVRKGNAHTTTVRACTEDEYKKVIEELP